MGGGTFAAFAAAGTAQGDEEPSAGRTEATYGDVAYEALFGGAVGGTVIAGFFLMADTVAGHPLRTPSIIGRMLLFDQATPVERIDLGAVSTLTAVHVVVFVMVGLAASLLVRGLWPRRRRVAAPAVMILALLEVPAFVVSTMLRPEIGARIGHVLILVANALAALAMALFLRYARATATPRRGRR